MEIATAGTRATGLFARMAVAIVWGALAVVAVVHSRHDAVLREPAAGFLRSFSIAERRPEYAETIRNAPSADWAADFVGDAAIQDVTAPVNLAGMDDATRQVWMRSVGRFDDELVAAETLVLSAIGARPGWSYHWATLGMLRYLRDLRAVRLADQPQKWFVPMQAALRFAPGDDSFAPFAGSALLTSWPFLSDDVRREAPAVLRVALHDVEFVADDYLAVADTLGPSAATALLPDLPAPLRAAVRAEAGAGDVAAAAALQRRWERAEWRSRGSDLKHIVWRAELGDRSGAARAATAWMNAHDHRDFDSAAGHAQLSRILEVWPDEPGVWPGDPRSQLALFFLDGRESDPAARLLDRNLSVLTDVPLPVQARAAAAAGDFYRAESIARRADTAGSFEWTRFYVDLASARLARKDLPAAAAALAMVSPAAREECDVRVARSIVGASGAGEVRGDAIGYWSGLNVSLCIEPAVRTLEVQLDAPAPALATYGFDGGRLGTLLIARGRNRLALPLAGRAGRHRFCLEVVAGGGLQPVSAALRP